MSPDRSTGGGSRRSYRLGKYEILSTFSYRALGPVNRAVDRDLDREVLLQLLPPEATAKKPALDRLQREVSRAMELRHDNVLHIVDCGNANGTWYLALEWLEANDLHDFSDKHPVTVSGAVAIVMQLARALQYLLDNGIMHGALRPASILIDEQGDEPAVKMFPPLLVRQPCEEEWRTTSSGLKIGPADYQAPEARGTSRPGDIRADIYSLGCLLYHLLAGRPPNVQSKSAGKKANPDEGVPDIRKFNEEVGEDLVAVLGKMLSPQPDDRYPGPAELLHELDGLDLRPLKRTSPHEPSSKEVEALFSNYNLLASLATDPHLPAMPRPDFSDGSLTEMETPARRKRASDRESSGNDAGDSDRENEDRPDGKGRRKPEKKQPSARRKVPPSPADLDDRGEEKEDREQQTGDLARGKGPAARGKVPTPSDELADDSDDEEYFDRLAHDKPRERMPGEPRKPSRVPAARDDGGTDDAAGATERKAARSTRNSGMPSADRSSRRSERVEPARPSGLDPDDAEPGRNAQPGSSTEDEESRQQWEKQQKQAEKKKLIIVAVCGVAFVVFGFAITQLVNSWLGTPGQPDSSEQPVAQGPPLVPPPPRNPQVSSSSERSSASSPLKVLYAPAQPIEAGKLRKEHEAPWAKPTVLDTAKAKFYRVSRIPVSTPTLPVQPDRVFPSLRAACEAVPPDQVGIIEIMDNGPLFETPIALKDRNLAIRAAPGYRPLIVWDVGESGTPPVPGADAGAFISATGGMLNVTNLEVAIKCDKPLDKVTSLFKVSEGEVRFNGCAFSIAGAAANGPGVAAVRFEATTPGKTCRLDFCFGRGSGLVAVDASAPAAEIMLDRCLMVGSEQPLLRVTGVSDAAPTVRCVRTTLVGGKTAIQLRGVGADANAPALNWIGWDSLIGRGADQQGGLMVTLPAGAGCDGIKWSAVNCLYSGWQTLIGGADPIAADKIDQWHLRWQMSEGDVAHADRFWSRTPDQLSAMTPQQYRPEETAFAYRGTEQDQPSRVQPLGFPPDDMAPARHSWLLATYDRAILPAAELLTTAPPIDTTNDGKYHGERLDVNKNDLGAYLRSIQAQKPFADQVVMHLHGTGEAKTGPIRVESKQSLILYFEPPRDSARPLILTPVLGGAATGQLGFFQVDQGMLQVVNATVLLKDSATTNTIRYLFHVDSGQLRLQGCRLMGPGEGTGTGFLAQVGVGGLDQSNEASAGGTSIGQIQECVFQSAKPCVHLTGNSSRLRIRQVLLVSLEDAMRFGAVGKFETQSLQCVLEHCTVAARRAAVRLEDMRGPQPQPTVQASLAEPILLQSYSNAFLNPFVDKEKKPALAGLVFYSPQALTRGDLVWQGDLDVYDKRLQFYAATLKEGTLSAGATQAPELWTLLWGHLGNRRPNHQLPLISVLDPLKPQLEVLALPGHPSLTDPTPGANLDRLLDSKK